MKPISKVIRGGGDDEISLWELPEVGDRVARAPEPPPEPEPEPPRQPTVQEIEALQKAAYEEAYAEGYQEGRETGHRDGYAAGEKEARRLSTQIAGILDALAAPLEQLDDEVEQQLLQLTLALAQQVIRRELQTQPGEVMAVVREALALLPAASREVRVHLHPDDAAFLREAHGEGDEARSWRLIDDPSLTRGGCRVVTAASQIDATLERRLATLAADFLGGSREEDQEGGEA